eukprot:CAMPEP_0172693926 /NCGR_PEP_ID=MMETSP1074-20121228/26347_1 /TAXON_ID=2916 /ORGANISM="Ceratium fusus, Strain PA161109" /LENGTH=33 /DNA_ID= /DNA_START= /DNA_END= /DNA_ORIENTATION=
MTMGSPSAESLKSTVAARFGEALLRNATTHSRS